MKNIKKKHCLFSLEVLLLASPVLYLYIYLFSCLVILQSKVKVLVQSPCDISVLLEIALAELLQK